MSVRAFLGWAPSIASTLRSLATEAARATRPMGNSPSAASVRGPGTGNWRRTVMGTNRGTSQPPLRMNGEHQTWRMNDGGRREAALEPFLSKRHHQPGRLIPVPRDPPALRRPPFSPLAFIIVLSSKEIFRLQRASMPNNNHPGHERPSLTPLLSTWHIFARHASWSCFGHASPRRSSCALTENCPWWG